MYISHRPDTNECTCSSCDMGPVREDNEKDEGQIKSTLDHLKLQFYMKGTNTTTTNRNHTLTGEHSSPTEVGTEPLSKYIVEGLCCHGITKPVPLSVADWIVGLTIWSELRVD